MMTQRLSLRIALNDVLFFFGWLICFLPPIFYRVGGTIIPIIRLTGLVYIVILFLSVTLKLKLPDSKISISLAFFLFWTVLIVAWKSSNMMMKFLEDMIIPVLEVSIMVYLCAYGRQNSQESKLRGFVSLYWLSIVYILLNFATMVLFPGGLIRSKTGSAVERANWLLGSKNNFSAFSVLCVTMVLLFTKDSFRSKVYSTVVCFVAFLSVAVAGEDGIEVLGGSSTGIVATFFLIVVMVMNYRKKEIPLLNVNFKWIFVAIIAMYVMIIGGTTISFIHKIVVDILHRDMSFTGRTVIWKQVMHYIEQSPLFGYGEQQLWYNLRISASRSGTTYVYNLFLKMLVSFGIVGTVLFCSVFFNIKKYRGKKYQILVAGIIATFACGLMDEVDFNFLFLFPLMISAIFDHDKPVKANIRE